MTKTRLHTTILATAIVAGSLSACMAALGPGSNVTQVPVVVLNFDPHLEGRGAPGIQEDQGWTPARVLADSLRATLWDLSFRTVLVDFVDFRHLDAFPVMADGRAYDMERYQRCLEDESACIDGPADLPAILERYGVSALIDNGVAREVWIFGGPHMGLARAAMVGPGALEIDAAYPRAGGERAFAVAGFDTDAGMGAVLQTYCRRVAVPVAHALNATPAGEGEWRRFTATAADVDTVGVGTCDHAPNALEPGVFSRADTVTSTAPQWVSYPVAPGATLPVSAAVWNGPDYRHRFLRWWFFHLPHGDRPSASGVPGSWWPLAYPD